MSKKEFGVGVVGAGVIGGGVVSVLIDKGGSLVDRAGVGLRLVRVADIDEGVPDRLGIDRSLFTTDAQSLIADPQVDIVVELVGGEDIAKDIVLKAFSEGKVKITADKRIVDAKGRPTNGYNLTSEINELVKGACQP